MLVPLQLPLQLIQQRQHASHQPLTDSEFLVIAAFTFVGICLWTMLYILLDHALATE